MYSQAVMFKYQRFLKRVKWKKTLAIRRQIDETKQNQNSNDESHLDEFLENKNERLQHGYISSVLFLIDTMLWHVVSMCNKHHPMYYVKH